MKFLPIVERELRVAARRGGTYWLRTWVAFTVGVVGSGIVALSLEEPPATVAFYLFHAVGGGALLYSLLMGARATADSLSEEKRDGTLGLLFLTNLRSYDVILGKLVAHSLNSFYGLIAIVPMAAISLLMGGISLEQVLCVSLVLVNTMFLSVSAGMCASACGRSARKTTSAAFVIVMLLTAGLPGLAMLLSAQGQLPQPLPPVYYITSPIFSYIAPQDFIFWRRDYPLFWLSLGVLHGLGWLLLVIACIVTPQAWKDRPPGAVRLRWRERWRQWGYGEAAQRLTYRRRLLDENAFFWLAARDRLKPAWVWGWLGALICFWYWGASRYGSDWNNSGVYLVTAFLANLTLKCWFALEATQRLSEERRAGSLELLLVTPLTVKDILHGQWLALRRQFFWPVMVVLAFSFWMMIAGLGNIYDTSDRNLWLAVWLCGIVSLLADLGALFWLGMWMGLSSRRPKRAYGDTVGRILALPWIIFALSMVIFFIATLRGSSNLTSTQVLGYWFCLGLVVDIGFGLTARTHLLTQFREIATQRFQRSSGFSLFGKKDESTGVAAPSE